MTQAKANLAKANPKDAKHDPLRGGLAWAHKLFPNLLDCRPSYVREAMGRAGFQIQTELKKHLWVPVKIVLGAKESP